MLTRPVLSIIIPAYNEEQNIPLILKRFAEVRTGCDFELIIVNNGSTDNSQQVIDEELKKPEYPFARTVLVEKNVGYGNGIFFGLKHAQADIIAYTHADLQCDPMDVIKAFQIISKTENPSQYLVKGWRKQRKLIPQLFTTGFQLLSIIIFWRVFNEINAQPKVFHKKFFQKLQYPPLDFNFDFYVYYKAKLEKLKMIAIPVEFLERKYGESKWAWSHLSKIKTMHQYLRYMLRLRFLSEEKARM